MKFLVLSILIALNAGAYSYKKGPMVIGDKKKPEVSAALEIASTEKGFLAPRMTSAQRDAIASPIRGLLIFNTDEVTFEVYNGLSWDGIAGSGGGVVEYENGEAYLVDSIVFEGTDFYKVLLDHTATDVATGIGNGAIIKMVDPNDYLVGLTSNVQDQLDTKVDKVDPSTDNAIVRFDGVEGDNQDSLVTIDDVGAINSPARSSFEGVEIGIGLGAITSNISIGSGSLDANTTGNFNTAIGVDSLTTNTEGSTNVGLGNQSLQFNTTGSNNLAIGLNSLRFNSTGANSVAIGLSSLRDGTTSNNVAIGNNTLRAGNSNNSVAIGINAGINSTGTNNTIIGAFLDTNESNSVIIGNNGSTRLEFDGSGNMQIPDYGISRTETESISFRLGVNDDGQLVQSGNASSTDNSIARFDGTNGDVQDSGVSIDDSNNISTAGDLIVGAGTGKQFDSVESFFRARSTGMSSPTTLTTNAGDNTLFDIGAVEGQIADFSGDLYFKINFAGQVGVTPLNPSGISYVFVDSAGSLMQQLTVPSASDRRDNIFVGRVITNGSNVVTQTIVNPVVTENIANSMYDLFEAIGTFNDSGNVITANGANLNLNKSLGKIFDAGANYSIDREDPHRVTINSCTICSFFYNTQTGLNLTPVTAIDPANYDLGGVVTAISGSNNRATNQRLFLFPSGNITIQYGQVIYPTIADAASGAPNETFIENPAFAGGVLVAILSVRKGATSLNLATDARLSYPNQFGGSSGAAGGVSTLQGAYNNSIAGGIILDSSRGNLKVLDNSTPIASPLFSVLSNDELTEYLNVTASLVSTSLNISMTGTGALKLPVGTTAQRPASPLEGMIRRNSETGEIEQYDGADWVAVGSGGSSQGIINFVGDNGDSANGAGDWGGGSFSLETFVGDNDSLISGNSNFSFEFGTGNTEVFGTFVDFTIDQTYKNRPLYLTLNYDTSIYANFSEREDIRVFVREKVSGEELDIIGDGSFDLSVSDQILVQFQATDVTEYEVGLKRDATSGGVLSNVIIKFDNIIIAPREISKSKGKTSFSIVFDNSLDVNEFTNENNVALSITNPSTGTYRVYYNTALFPSDPLVSPTLNRNSGSSIISNYGIGLGSDGSGEYYELIGVGSSHGGVNLNGDAQYQVTFTQKEEDQTAFQISTDLGNRELRVFAQGNDGGAVTADTENVNWTSLEDTTGGAMWTGDTLVAPVTGTYSIKAVATHDSSGAFNVDAYIDENDGSGFVKAYRVGLNNNFGTTLIRDVVRLKKGWKYAIRFAAGRTLSNSTDSYISIVKLGNDAPFLAPVTPQITIFKDIKSVSVDGGTATSGSYEIRDLNVQEGLSTFASLSSNQITLTKGKYVITGSAPAFSCNTHQIRLYDVTNSAVLAHGTSEFSSSVDNTQTRSSLDTVLTITESTTIRLEHRVSSTKAGDGYGLATGFNEEVYSTLKIQKVY